MVNNDLLINVPLHYAMDSFTTGHGTRRDFLEIAN